MTGERYGRCMKRGRRDVVRAFLDELGAVPFTEDARLYRIGRRLLLAELVLAEIRDDDVERMAIRPLAEVARERCLSPIDREVGGRFIAARWAHVDVAKGSYLGRWRRIRQASTVSALAGGTWPPRPARRSDRLASGVKPTKVKLLGAG
jgi:hypothetical protein